MACQYFLRQVMDLSYFAFAEHNSIGPPARGHALSHEPFGSADERHSAGRRDVPARGVIAHEKLRPGDMRRERSERAVVSTHTWEQGSFHALTFFGTPALVDQD